MSEPSTKTIEDVASAARCTCTPARRSYTGLHSVYCARVAAPAAIRAILEAAAPHLATTLSPSLLRSMAEDAIIAVQQIGDEEKERAYLSVLSALDGEQVAEVTQ
jgi:hypothetical protein